MSRDQVVSLRVTDDEMRQLRELGGPTAALRHLLGQNNAANPIQRVIPVTTNGCAPSPVFVRWNNGAIGATYPAVMSG